MTSTWFEKSLVNSWGVVPARWFKPTLSAKVTAFPEVLCNFLFEELVFSFRSPLLTSESTNTVLWEEDEDAVKSTELWGQDKKLR